MPPIRRYIRISPHSLLEVRIFLENPADASRWLLSRTDPALPRVFAAVQPLILPKLREERERTAQTRNKGKKGKSVKDVVEGDGFRCVVFLTEGATRHEVVVKRRRAGEERAIREEEDDDGEVEAEVDLRDVPEWDGDGDGEVEEVGFRVREGRRGIEGEDDKKKLGFETRYDGFSIWGKVLCLLVERTGENKKKKVGAGEESEGAQKVMQEWISSTQVGAEDEDV